MEAIEDQHVNVHKAKMFDAITAFFNALTSLANMGSDALKAQLEADRQKRR